MAVLFPRFTTLAGNYVFASPALDVGRFGGMQLRVWWSERLGTLGSTPTTVHFDESLDGVDWPTDASTSFQILGGTYDSKFFSIGFRMRWFRMRIDTQCEYLTLWAEGVLRAGSMGAKEWVLPRDLQAMDPTAMLGRKRGGLGDLSLGAPNPNTPWGGGGSFDPNKYR